MWLANVFWAPMRELNVSLAGAVGHAPRDYQKQMTRLLDLIEAGDDAGAEAHVVAWFDRIDAGLVRDLERLLDLAAGAGSTRAGAASVRRPTAGPEPRGPRRAAEGKGRSSKAQKGKHRTVKR